MPCGIMVFLAIDSDFPLHIIKRFSSRVKRERTSLDASQLFAESSFAPSFYEMGLPVNKNNITTRESDPKKKKLYGSDPT